MAATMAETPQISATTGPKPTLSQETTPASSTTTTTNSNPLTRKLQRILGGGTANDRGPLDKDVLEALDGLSAMFPDNTKHARTNLRGDLERHGLSINEQFISAFTQVQNKLSGIQADIGVMSSCCSDMTTRLSVAREQTSDLIKRTTLLKGESKQADLHAEVLDLFLERYQLTDSEKKALDADELDAKFFDALEKVRVVHDRCKVLLRTREQSAGLTIMESMAALQETSYERLYRWTQSTCRGLTHVAAEHPSVLAHALQALRNRSVLFEFCITELSNARHNAVVHGFIEALTHGSAGGLTRPIELHSHDPVRYVSDMLAWLHECAASEKEQFVSLIAKSAEPRHTDTGSPRKMMSPRPNISSLGPADRELLNQSLDKALEGATRPLQARVEQVLGSGQSEVVVCYQLTNLLKFYGNTINRVLEFQPSLVTVLFELHALALRIFFDQLNIHANTLLVEVAAPPDDLSVPTEVDKALDLLRSVLACQDAYSDKSSDHVEDLEKILECVLDPLLEMCTISASGLSATKGAVYLGNCIYQVETTLAVYEHTEDRVKMLGQLVGEHLNLLVEEQAHTMLGRSGLGAVMLQMQTWEVEPEETRKPLSSIEELSPEAIKSAVDRLDNYLSSADFGLEHPCDLLLSSKMRNAVVDRSIKFIVGLYERFYNAVRDPTNAFVAPEKLLPRTPAQLTALMQ
eukprot:m.178473 g.178473  ORF g.178473 m.178473 type:complete len:692 (+) comp31941_c0_seq1:198-2273(+)